MCELTHGMAGERHGKSVGAAWARHAMCESAFRGNQNTHFMFNNIFLENRAVYEVMWKNMVQPDRL
jgi:hypothetical protein